MPLLDAFDQHPSAVVDYVFEVEGLGSNTISSATAALVSGVGLTVAQPTFAGALVTTRCSTPTAGVVYQVEVVVTISNGEKPVKEWLIYGVNR